MQRLAKRVGVGLAGGILVLVGVALLALPGPGWLVIFAGLGVLATEYEWAARLLTWVRRRVTEWTRWAAARPLWVRLVGGFVSLVLLAGLFVAAWFVWR